MLGEAQDVLLAAETSLARHHNRRRNVSRRLTSEAPHCHTCCCLDNSQVTCTQRCTSSRRHSTRRNTTVDELLCEMNLNMPTLSDDETYVNVKNEVEEESPSPLSPVSLACPGRASHRSSSYCEASKSQEITVRSCERWPHLEMDNTSHIGLTKSGDVERSERYSDGSKQKWTSCCKKNSRRLQQLFGAGDRNAQVEELAKVTDGNEVESTSKIVPDEAHIRKLKLERWHFIERIYDEVCKLYSIQRHLEGSSLPPLPTTLAHRRNVSTMTSARQTEPNISGQF